MSRNNFCLALMNMADGQIIPQMAFDDYPTAAGLLNKAVCRQVHEWYGRQPHLPGQEQADIAMRTLIEERLAKELLGVMLRHPVLVELKERVGSRLVGTVTVLSYTTPSGGHVHGPDCPGCHSHIHDHSNVFHLPGSVPLQDYVYFGLPAFAPKMDFDDVISTAIKMDIKEGKLTVEYGKYTVAQK